MARAGLFLIRHCFSTAGAYEGRLRDIPGYSGDIIPYKDIELQVIGIMSPNYSPITHVRDNQVYVIGIYH